MCSCLQCDETSRYLSKGLLHRFRCGRQFLFQNDLACFIQNTVERPTISQIQSDRQLLLFEDFALECLHSAILSHKPVSFALRLERVNRWERIASRRRPAFSSHLISRHLARNTTITASAFIATYLRRLRTNYKPHVQTSKNLL